MGWEIRAQRNATGAASSWEEVNVDPEDVSRIDPEEEAEAEEAEAEGGEAEEREAEEAQSHGIPAPSSSPPPTLTWATDWSRYFHWEAGSYWWHSPSSGEWM